MLIRCANAGSVVEKTLASGLADAFSQHLPAWQAKCKLVFFPRDFWAKQGHLRSRMSDVFSQSRASLLVKGFESAAPAWLVQAQPCVPLSSSVPIRVIRGSKFIAPRVSIPAWRF
jgi:hypothetical protein